MAEQNEQIEAFLREVGLIPADYSGKVEVTATTSEGSDNLTIKV
jgi:hypothetical protein